MRGYIMSNSSNKIAIKQEFFKILAENAKIVQESDGKVTSLHHRRNVLQDIYQYTDKV